MHYARRVAIAIFITRFAGIDKAGSSRPGGGPLDLAIFPRRAFRPNGPARMWRGRVKDTEMRFNPRFGRSNNVERAETFDILGANGRIQLAKLTEYKLPERTNTWNRCITRVCNFCGILCPFRPHKRHAASLARAETRLQDRARESFTLELVAERNVVHVGTITDSLNNLAE